MFDLKYIRENTELVRQGLLAKKASVKFDELLALDQQRRVLIAQLDDLRAQKNSANDEISWLLKEKKDTKEKISSMKSIAAKIDELQPQLKTLEDEISQILLSIPNVPHSSVPAGSAGENRVVRQGGPEAKKLAFEALTHIELAEKLDIVDFKRAAKISGANFILFKKEGALLERALYNFMLDVHTRQHGYSEIFPPFLVNRASMTGTGQLPKMEEDMYHLKDDDLFLIPTAEVPVTNIFRDDVIAEEELPIYYSAYTACFRREAGSYGKDTKGLIRVHQFDKVELVKFVKPGSSYEELEKLVQNAEKILRLLELPYRVLLLASGDLSFAASKCYDLEVYAPGMDKWLEVSSCSNFEDFQARRANIRYKEKKSGKTYFCHTLNGSGLALARTVIAILENYQTKEGEILIPHVLQGYMNGLKKIKVKG